MKLCKKIVCVTIFSSFSFLHGMEEEELPKLASFDERLSLLEQQVETLQRELKIHSTVSRIHRAQDSSNLSNSTKPEMSSISAILQDNLEIKKKMSGIEEMQTTMNKTLNTMLGLVTTIHQLDNQTVQSTPSVYTTGAQDLWPAYDKTKHKESEGRE